MFSLRPVIYILGVILCIIGLCMTIPMFVDLHHKGSDWKVFALSSFITFFSGTFMFLTSRSERIAFNLRQAILLTPLTWFMVSLFSALPFYLADLKLNFAHAFFEAVSGLTTTGATVIVGLDHAAKGILLWRAILQYLGGLGIIAATLIILPALGVGGMTLFKNESFGSDQKHLPRTSEVAKSLFSIYTLLCFMCAVGFYWSGMSGFDAITHSFFTLSNGGFSNYDASFGYFNNVWAEIVAIIFMLLGAMPFILYFKILKNGDLKSFWKDPQATYFLGLVALVILSLTIWVTATDTLKASVKDAPPHDTAEGFFAALRYVSFNVVSIMATCGFVSTDYNAWGSFAQIIFFLVVIIGGCNGSTAGGIKIFRLKILLQMVRSQALKLISPHGVFRPQYGHKSVSDDILTSIAGYFFIYLCSIFVGAVLLTLTGLDFLTSLSSIPPMLANAGPALGSVAGPAGNYSSFSDSAIYVCCLMMIAGRLEILTLLILLSRKFWRE